MKLENNFAKVLAKFLATVKDTIRLLSLFYNLGKIFPSPPLIIKIRGRSILCSFENKQCHDVIANATLKKEISQQCQYVVVVHFECYHSKCNQTISSTQCCIFHML